MTLNYKVMMITQKLSQPRNMHGVDFIEILVKSISVEGDIDKTRYSY